jgi:HSP20 family protein
MIIRRLTDWPAADWRRPYEGFEQMRRDMDRLFNALSGRITGEFTAGVFPLMNISEDKDHFYVRSELPGIKAGELDISVTGESLSISGERKISEESGQAKYHRREREAGKFSRVVSLPSQIEPEKAEASSTDGVLTIKLPKAEVSRPKQITVKASK